MYVYVYYMCMCVCVCLYIYIYVDWFSRHINILRTRTDMVLEKLFFLLFNQLTLLVAREYLIIQTRHESYKLYKSML
jgi:hypothetical protein